MEPVAAKTAWEGMNAGKRQEGEKYEWRYYISNRGTTSCK